MEEVFWFEEMFSFGYVMVRKIFQHQLSRLSRNLRGRNYYMSIYRINILRNAYRQYV